MLHTCNVCGPFSGYRFANELTGQIKASYQVFNLQVSLVAHYILHIFLLWDSEGWQYTGVAVSTVYSALFYILYHMMKWGQDPDAENQCSSNSIVELSRVCKKEEKVKNYGI